jgi:hypothetical protein
MQRQRGNCCLDAPVCCFVRVYVFMCVRVCVEGDDTFVLLGLIVDANRERKLPLWIPWINVVHFEYKRTLGLSLQVES